MLRSTSIIEQAAAGRIKREHIYANVKGAWGIGGKAFSNDAQDQPWPRRESRGSIFEMR
ncbi:MAG: hypothetical protein JO141_30455 [Bradyrhizobium sp.]|nr:hypothetical protein [Bradyrhizobium sp.]